MISRGPDRRARKSWSYRGVVSCWRSAACRPVHKLNKEDIGFKVIGFTVFKVQGLGLAAWWLRCRIYHITDFYGRGFRDFHTVCRMYWYGCTLKATRSHPLQSHCTWFAWFRWSNIPWEFLSETFVSRLWQQAGMQAARTGSYRLKLKFLDIDPNGASSKVFHSYLAHRFCKPQSQKS